MRFTPKDTVATAFVAAVVVIYAGYLAFDGIPLVRDVTGMAAVGLILGFGSMALGIATLITESEILLAVFVASITALWVAATYVRTHVDRTSRTGQVPIAH